MKGPPTDAQLDPARTRWRLLAGAWAIYFSFGLVVGATAALVPVIRDDLDLSRGEMGLVLGTWQLVYLGASVPAGRLLDRVGLRWGLVIAAIVIAASGLLRALAVDLVTLLLAVGLFGVGGPLISIGAPKLVSVWFSDRDRRIAVSIYGTAPAIGITLALALANGVVAPAVGDSLRWTMASFSLVAVLGAAAWLAIATGVEDRAVAADDVTVGLSSLELLRLPVVRVVLVLAVGGFLYSHALGNWLVEIIEDQGRSVAAAGYWAALPTFVGIGATLSIPRLATPSRRVAILGGAFVAGSVAVIGVLAASAIILAPALVAAGITRTTIMPLSMLILMDHRDIGSRNMAAAGGLFFTAAEIGGVAGPALTGLLAQTSGGFELPVAVLSAVMASMALLTMALPRALR